MRLSNDVEKYEIEVTKNGSKLLFFSYSKLVEQDVKLHFVILNFFLAFVNNYVILT